MYRFHSAEVSLFATSQIINVDVELHFLDESTVAKVWALTFSCFKSRAADLSLMWIYLTALCNLMMTGDMAAVMRLSVKALWYSLHSRSLSAGLIAQRRGD